MRKTARKANKQATTALPLVRTWSCPRCPFTNEQLAAERKKGVRRCGNDGAALVNRGVHHELYGHARCAQELIDGRARLYNDHRDPFRLWEVYWLAWNFRESGVEMPAWVTDYLARVARRMTDISIALSEGKPLDTLRKALELDGHGQGAVSGKRSALRRRQQYVVDVIEIMDKGYNQPKAIGLLLDALGPRNRAVDRRTIERAMSDYKQKGWIVAGGRGGGAPLLPSEEARQVKAR